MGHVGAGAGAGATRRWMACRSSSPRMAIGPSPRTACWSSTLYALSARARGVCAGMR
jgi:hypothetical protein